ncbi:MAG: hypothetical protein AAGF07_01545 [Patescibacteria group bacterium]
MFTIKSINQILQKIALSMVVFTLLSTFVLPLSSMALTDSSTSKITKEEAVAIEKIESRFARRKERIQKQFPDLNEIELAEKVKEDILNDLGFTPVSFTLEEISKIDDNAVPLVEGQFKLNNKALSELPLTTEQKQFVRQSVDLTNNLINLIKAIETVDSVDFNFGIINAFAGCDYETRTNWNWWGVELWLNNCIINDLGSGGAAAPIVVKLAGLEPTPIGELVLAYLGIYVIVLMRTNNACDNRGANLNIPYVSSTLIWVSSVC